MSFDNGGYWILREAADRNIGYRCNVSYVPNDVSRDFEKQIVSKGIHHYNNSHDVSEIVILVAGDSVIGGKLICGHNLIIDK